MGAERKPTVAETVDLYPSFLNCLLRLAFNCSFAEGLGDEDEDNSLAVVLAKLNDEEQKLLTAAVSAAYSSGIKDTLLQLEGLNEYANLPVNLRGVPILAGTFQGAATDFWLHYQQRRFLNEGRK